MKYNLGCGFNYMLGYCNIDSDNKIKTDYVKDFNQENWTNGLRKSERILAYHVLEHLKNPILFLKECEKLMYSDGKLIIKVPCVYNTNGFEDPTHIKYFTPETFKHYFSNDFKHYNTDKGLNLRIVKTKLIFENKIDHLKHLVTRVLFNYTLSLSFVKEIVVVLKKRVK